MRAHDLRDVRMRAVLGEMLRPEKTYACYWEYRGWERMLLGVAKEGLEQLADSVNCILPLSDRK